MNGNVPGAASGPNGPHSNGQRKLDSHYWHVNEPMKWELRHPDFNLHQSWKNHSGCHTKFVVKLALGMAAFENKPYEENGIDDPNSASDPRIAFKFDTGARHSILPEKYRSLSELTGWTGLQGTHGDPVRARLGKLCVPIFKTWCLIEFAFSDIRGQDEALLAWSDIMPSPLMSMSAEFLELFQREYGPDGMRQTLLRK